MKPNFADLVRFPMDTMLEIVARNDRHTMNPHIVQYGKGQRAAIRILARALEDWTRENPSR